ncbi:MAG: DUF421 domain-containing protein [Pseudolabrys sp.]|nr:DUF421 domain-containing protein [Pseudolabrys sp.]
MEQLLIDTFGVQNQLSIGQEAARAVLIFFYGLVLLRVCGPRVFGHWSAIDIVISIIVGSALARTMTGSAPLVGTMVATGVLAMLHLIISHLVARNTTLAHIVEGRAVTLIVQGRIDQEARKRNKISESDMHEALREQGVDGEEKIANVKRMTLEPSGKLSVVKIDPCKSNHD